MLRFLVAAGLALVLAIGGGSACSAEDRPPPFAAAGSGGAGGFGVDSGNTDGPPAADAPGLCGNLVLPAITNKPNVYFILDRSGSMQDKLPGSTYDKYLAARVAIADVLKQIGHRVRYGAAVFPMAGGSIDGCAAGAEIFATRDGDPASYAASGELGPVLSAFLLQTAKYGPSGGTPTAPTIEALRPTLTALSGKTVVILATDGAPNCNQLASCPAAECGPVIENQTLGGKQCSASFNCCDPAVVPGGQLYCVDDDATEAAIAELAAAGIDTYVIGMPGSEFYDDLLDRLAIAGNTARPTPPHYYPISSSTELGDALRAIGVEIAISCTIALGQTPPDPALVNVYFDTTLVGYDEVDGWAWLDPTTIELRGAACALLKSGDILQVQVVSGCPTVIR
jgi:hypothetical protein